MWGTSVKNHALSGHTILVVEDEPLIAIELRQHLVSAGAYVFGATQLPHALQLAGHPDISAAVVGYRLGHDDSTAICSRLEERSIPFMFYSRHDELHKLWPNTKRVPKPTNPHEIVGVLRAILESSFVHATKAA